MAWTEILFTIVVWTGILIGIAYLVWRYFYYKTRCKKCKQSFSLADLTLVAGELKWENKESQSTRNVRGAMYINDDQIIEITRYRIYFRMVSFRFRCPKCGLTYTYSKRFNLYDNRSKISATTSELDEALHKKVEWYLGKKFLEGKRVRIKNIDY